MVFLALAVSSLAPPVCVDNPTCPEILYTFPVEGMPATVYGLTFQPKLGQKSPATQALILVHGTNRNANQYACWALEAVTFAQQNTNDTLVFAPWFPLLTDIPPTNALYWDDNSEWKKGGKSTTNYTTRVSSFSVLDTLIDTLSDTRIYPNMKRIVLAGHSAGGQVVSTYSVIGRPQQDKTQKNNTFNYPELLFRPANPSTWTYLDSARPGPFKNGSCTVSYCDNITIPYVPYSFATPPLSVQQACPDFDDWRYGFENRNSYAKKLTQEEAIAQFKTRLLTTFPSAPYKNPLQETMTDGKNGRVQVKTDQPLQATPQFLALLGGADVCNDLFCPDTTCDAREIDNACGGEMQGLCRFQRGWVYYHYLQQYYTVGEGSTMAPPLVVPNIGHDACGIFVSVQGAQALFSVYR